MTISNFGAKIMCFFSVLILGNLLNAIFFTFYAAFGTYLEF